MRQQLEQRDYRVNFRMARSCETDIKKYHCLDHAASVAGFKTAMMSAVLLCLESAMKDGKYQKSVPWAKALTLTTIKKINFDLYKKYFI